MPSAIIAGGSVGGLFAANLLADLGWDVRVYERVADDLAARGAGIGTHEQLHEALAGLGIAMDERLGVKVGDRVCVDREGRTLARIPWAHIMSAWANVYRPLKARFPAERYFFSKNLQRYEERSDGVVAHFSDGTEAKADLLVGADGLRSVVRAQMYPGRELQYAGYVAWRGYVDEMALPRETREWLGNEYFFVLPPGEMFLCYPIPGRAADARPGARDWNVVWYRPVKSEAALRDLCTGTDGKHHGLHLPPPLLRPEVIARYKADARALLAPPLATLVEHTPPFFQAMFDFEPPRMAAGRVALLGDAAFTARPHVGMGVTKAAMDALCLSRSIKTESEIEKALARYDTLRGEFGRRCVARGRYVGSFIEAAARPHLPWTPADRDQDPHRVLRESAASLNDIPELAELREV